MLSQAAARLRHLPPHSRLRFSASTPLCRNVSTSTLLRSSPLRGQLLATRSASTTALAVGQLSRHARNISFVSAAARAAGRMGGRVVGLGAVGAGGAAYVGSQVDGVVQQFHSVYGSVAKGFGDFTSAAGSTLDAFGKDTAETLSSVSQSVGDGLSSARERVNGLWADLADRFSSEENGGDDSSSSYRRTGHDNQGPKSRPPYGEGGALLGAATAAQLPLFLDSEDDSRTSASPDTTAGLMNLTRKLIEIRTLLMSIDHDESLVLPSIVVIGSQSSGKSSVLEAIVGHEFLPKGNNMVTRRPLELTLVHTAPTASNPNPQDYAECPQFGPGQFSDFSEIQRRLTKLNLDVSDSIAVDDNPIHLRIHSRNVPDLSLVDLPGYVQISSMDQPEELREKITSLCDKYIKKPNIILAVCAADVDLANSPALRASRKVDPHGYRTVGVITKMDLVDPTIGASILSNEKYKLALGYIGVICKAATSSTENRLIRRHNSPSAAGVAEHETSFFKSHADVYDQPNMLIGMSTLKGRLMKVLEESMGSSLHDISNRVSLELEEATYQFKVQYNDRPISADTYVAETMDAVKARVAEFGRALTKLEVRSMLKNELDQKVQELLAEIYWVDRRTAELGKLADSKITVEELEPYWSQRLELAQSRLTKSGIGRTSTELVADELKSALIKLVGREPLHHHPQAVEKILTVSDDILEDLHGRASDHVEIAVMPYRYDVELDKVEWEKGRSKAIELMAKEVELCDEFVKTEKGEVRKNWRFREAVEYVKEMDEKMRKQAQRRLQTGEVEGEGLEVMEDVRPPPLMLDRARRLRDLDFQLQTLKLRQAALKSRRCKMGFENKSFCPEIFLNVVADRLAHTATDFINIDLLSRYFSTLPHELNSQVIKQLEGEAGVAFAWENGEVRRHLELQDRKEKLERVMRELATLAHMQDDASGGSGASPGSHRHNRRRKASYFSGLF